jgi:hypothetical protein
MESGTFYLLRVLRCRVFIVVRLQRLRHRTEACHESLVAGSGTDAILRAPSAAGPQRLVPSGAERAHYARQWLHAFLQARR